MILLLYNCQGIKRISIIWLHLVQYKSYRFSKAQVNSNEVSSNCEHPVKTEEADSKGTIAGDSEGKNQEVIPRAPQVWKHQKYNNTNTLVNTTQEENLWKSRRIPIQIEQPH